jgi:hypothetical protein
LESTDVKLVHEKQVNLLVRTHGNDCVNTPLMPGDLVRHWHDRDSAGLVVAVSDDARDSPGIEALVLWAKLPFNGNYPQNTFDASVNNVAKQISDHFDAQILQMLASEGWSARRRC